MGERTQGKPVSLLGTGRHLSNLELETWTAFLDASRLIDEALSRHLADEHEMNHSDYEVLVRLDGSGGTLRLSVLADQCVSSRSKLTHTLNRVEKRGWIRRQPVDSDGRGLEASITNEGGIALAAASDKHAQLIRDNMLALWDPDELSVVKSSLQKATQHMRNNRRA